MQQHISQVVCIGYYRLHRLRHLGHHVTQDAVKQLVCSFILSKIDYYNSILTGLPASSTSPLQRLQNAAARLVMVLRARDRVVSALAGLNWLPVHFRISYKVAITMFFIHTNQCPAYLSNIVIALHSNPSCQRLRSSAGTDSNKDEAR